jgi:hypothetical protein
MLRPSIGTTGDSFGTSVSISGRSIAIGAPGVDQSGSNSGAIHVFVRSGTSWFEAPFLLAGDGAPMDLFGNSVSVSKDVVVGGAVGEDDGGTDSGAAYVFSPPPAFGNSYCACVLGPCGWVNPTPGAGCANATGEGALLRIQGTAEPDELHLLISGARPGQAGVLFQGDSAMMMPFGAGYLCVTGGIVRITRPPVVVGTDGALIYGPCVGDVAISSVTVVVPGSGVTKRYQFWYRDPVGLCGATFNLSNGYEVTW